MDQLGGVGNWAPRNQAGDLSFRAGHILDRGPHLVFPAGVAGHGQHDLAVMEEDEARRRRGSRLAFFGVQEGGTDRPRGGRPALFLRHQVGIGRIDNLIVEFLEGVGLEEIRLGLGTPDLAAASKLVADEHQRRAPSLGLRDAGQRRCGCHHQATHHQRPSIEHYDSLLVENSTRPV